MKNEKIGKLSLKKETVARLNVAQMNEVKGGSIILANTAKCYIAVIDYKPIPPCTISPKVFETVQVIR
ncbi:MAG TPA: class I lanthipeptide [Bacteroidia bacterium]|jgi:natural product precursor|nr:class I lanthipeptide [Bacteroidia bacterium]